MRAHSVFAARLATGILLSLGFVACGSKPDAGLFRVGGTLGGGANAGDGPSETSGESNAAGSSGSSAAASASNAGDSSASGASHGGTSGNTGNGGAATASGGGSSGAPAAGGEAGGAGQIGSSECGVHGANATFFSGTQHCYLVVHELATYADAKTHCSSLGAHLVTLSNKAEDAFAWSISPEEHWIGASDGKGDKEPDPGTYSWVTGEPFTFTNWSSGQPNASQTQCGDSNGGGTCYEHCAFQWTGGEHDGQWNDRYCMHTIAAICEWDDASGGN